MIKIRILKKYLSNNKLLGVGSIKAMIDYINFCKNNGGIITFSDIIYNEKEYNNFLKWFEESIVPFDIIELFDSGYSIILDQEYYEYDWLTESRTKSNYGDGHDYEFIFKLFISDKLSYLNSSLKFDSENGMFCVSCNDIEKVIELIYELSCLYKNENKMIKLIRKGKLLNCNIDLENIKL